MAIKLALLRSGEQVIADIMELVDKDEKVIQLVFSDPYIVRLLTSELLMEGSYNEEEEIEHKVGFSPWLVLSADQKMAVNPDWVVTVVEPHEWIKSSYTEKTESSDEEPESDEVVENFEVITEEING